MCDVTGEVVVVVFAGIIFFGGQRTQQPNALSLSLFLLCGKRDREAGNVPFPGGHVAEKGKPPLCQGARDFLTEESMRAIFRYFSFCVFMLQDIISSSTFLGAVFVLNRFGERGASWEI